MYNLFSDLIRSRFIFWYGGYDLYGRLNLERFLCVTKIKMEKEPLQMNAEATENSKDVKKKVQVGFLELFRFATRMDKLMMFVGAVAAILSGLALPLMVNRIITCHNAIHN